MRGEQIGRHTLGYFDRDLLFLAFADDRQCRIPIFARGVHEDDQLSGINDLLVVVKLQDIVFLQASRGGGAVWQHVIHHEAEVFRQAQLGSENWRHG